MTELNLTREQQKILLPLITQLDRAAMDMVNHPSSIEAEQKYESAYRALWAVAGGRF